MKFTCFVFLNNNITQSDAQMKYGNMIQKEKLNTYQQKLLYEFHLTVNNDERWN